jgi:hypothetical protein
MGMGVIMGIGLTGSNVVPTGLHAEARDLSGEYSQAFTKTKCHVGDNAKTRALLGSTIKAIFEWYRWYGVLVAKYFVKYSCYSTITTTILRQ